MYSITATFYPYITGIFMGDVATLSSIYKSCYFLFGFAVLGMICSFVVLLTENNYKLNLEIKEKDRIRNIKCWIELENMIRDANLREAEELKEANLQEAEELKETNDNKKSMLTKSTCSNSSDEASTEIVKISNPKKKIF